MKASVVVPAYNAEKSIGQCIKAVQAQSFKDFEIIVVDDGSSDRTAEIVKRFKGVKLLQQQNAGPAKARNNGAKAAKGEIVVFTDSDCVPTMEWLEEMLKPFSDAIVVGVQGRYKTKQGSLVARFIQLEIEQRYEKMLKHEFIDFIGSYAAAYRQKVFEGMNGFDTSFPIASGEDTDLSFRIHKAGHRMVFNPKALVFHSHPESLLKYIKVKFFRAFWRMKLYRKHKKKTVKDAYTPQTVKLQTGLFFAMLAALIAGPFIGMVWITPIAFGLLIVSTLPFAAWAFAKDKAVGLVSPLVIFLRTVAFGLGMIAGIVNQLVGSR